MGLKLKGLLKEGFRAHAHPLGLGYEKLTGQPDPFFGDWPEQDWGDPTAKWRKEPRALTPEEQMFRGMASKYGGAYRRDGGFERTRYEGQIGRYSTGRASRKYDTSFAPKSANSALWGGYSPLRNNVLAAMGASLFGPNTMINTKFTDARRKSLMDAIESGRIGGAPNPPGVAPPTSANRYGNGVAGDLAADRARTTGKLPFPWLRGLYR